MIINTVKKNGGIYIVNDDLIVLANQRDPLYFEVQKWLDDGGVLTPLYSLESLKNKKKEEIKKSLATAEVSNKTLSSLGFMVDATRVSKDNVKSLLDLGVEPVNFRDADNEFHLVYLSDLAIMHKEIIMSAFGLYQKKWNLESMVDSATSEEDLALIQW